MRCSVKVSQAQRLDVASAVLLANFGGWSSGNRLLSEKTVHVARWGLEKCIRLFETRIPMFGDVCLCVARELFREGGGILGKTVTVNIGCKERCLRRWWWWWCGKIS